MSSLDHSTNYKGEKTGYVKPTHSYYHIQHRGNTMTDWTHEEINQRYIDEVFGFHCFMIHTDFRGRNYFNYGV